MRGSKAYFNGGKVVHSIKGKGVATPLLSQQIAGPASSYTSLDDYIQTTGLNPLQQSKGRGLGNMNDKLENLLIKSKKGKKEKNITFSI